MVSAAARLVAAVLVAWVAAAAVCLSPEGFTFATDVCDSINRESRVYRSSPRLRELCERAGSINPQETCLVDCDVRSLCGNPSVGYCRHARGSDHLCDVSDNYYGSHPENSNLPRVYRVRRGACLVSTSGGAFVCDAAFLGAVLRFPDTVSVVGGVLAHGSRFRKSWTLSLPPDGGGDASLPLATHDFVEESTARARELGVSARVPTAILHESCVSPGGEDTSYQTDAPLLQDRLVRAAEHANQPSSLHVTMRFVLPATARVVIGGSSGLVYESFTTGRPKPRSPASGAEMYVGTDVWLMLEVLPGAGVISEVREVLSGPGGVMRVSRGTGRTPVDIRSFLSYSGEAPSVWLGMRDAARDIILA